MKKLFMAGAIFFIISLKLYAQPIEPGLVITKDNYQQFLPELKELLDPGNSSIIIDYLSRGIITIPLQKKKEYPKCVPLHQATMKYEGTCKVGPDNELIGWKAGMPFPNPARGVELAWDLDRKSGVQDQSSMVGEFYLFDKGCRLERKYKWKYCNFYYTGRVFVPPFHEAEGNDGIIRLKESFVMLEPFDIKGFSFIRTRYEDVDKPDDVYSYIPAIRRLRRLTGSDVCDPMLGTDAIFDDFEMNRQKITPHLTFKMREEKMLVPSVDFIGNRPPVRSGLHQYKSWEIRNIYVLETYIDDPDYIYSRRVTYIEKQRFTGAGYYVNTYDGKGRLFRSQIYYMAWGEGPHFKPEDRGATYYNYLTGHHTLLECFFKMADPECKPSIFSFRWLLRQAR